MIERGQQWSRRDVVIRCVAGSVSIALLASCGAGSDPPGPTPSVPSAPPQETQPEAMMPTPTPRDNTPTPEAEALPRPVLLAVEAAAIDASIDPGDVQILSFTERQWPSTALGCPLPGFSYAQVVTPGYEILLQAGEREYEYHSNLTNNVVLCAGG